MHACIAFGIPGQHLSYTSGATREGAMFQALVMYDANRCLFLNDRYRMQAREFTSQTQAVPNMNFSKRKDVRDP